MLSSYKVSITTTARNNGRIIGFTNEEINDICTFIYNDPSAGRVSEYPPIFELTWHHKATICYLVLDRVFEVEVMIIAISPICRRKAHPAEKQKVIDQIERLIIKGVIAFFMKKIFDFIKEYF